MVIFGGIKISGSWVTVFFALEELRKLSDVIIYHNIIYLILVCSLFHTLNIVSRILGYIQLFFIVVVGYWSTYEPLDDYIMTTLFEWYLDSLWPNAHHRRLKTKYFSLISWGLMQRIYHYLVLIIYYTISFFHWA